jgi:hypothetical protein
MLRVKIVTGKNVHKILNIEPANRFAILIPERGEIRGVERMVDRRFDQLAQLMAASGSRRRWLALFAGLIAGGRVANTAADDGIAIADASGGD